MNQVIGAKAGSSSSRTPKVQDDSAASKTYVRMVYGMSEGEIEGLARGLKSVYLDDTPIESENGSVNFEDVLLDARTGTNDQTFMQGFPNVSSEIGINVELKTTWTRAFSNTTVDAINVRLMWGALRTTDSSNGDVTGVTIQYAIDLSTDGSSYQTVLDTQISDKTSANYQRTHKIVLPPASMGWTIRVRRITPSAESDYVSDKMYVDAVAEIIDAKFAYPNTAVVGLQYDAESFSNVAKLAIEAKGLKIRVPSNRNSDGTYIGVWDGSFKREYSNNPAWIFYDLCTAKRYGLGKRIAASMLDKASLYRLGQYCDELVSDGEGGQEPRFTCNIYIQSAEDAYAILNKLAGVFRSISYWDGDSIICDADIPQDTYFAYSRANVIDGVFEYSGTRARDRHTVVRVAWDNPANRYKTEYEIIREDTAIAKLGVNVLELQAWGCTSRGQAQRAGLWALKSEQLETRTVTFKVGLDGNIPMPGKIIEVSDNLFAGRANGGRVSAISSDRKVITLDREVVATSGDTLVVNGEDGQAQRRTIVNVTGKQVTVSLAFTNIAVEHIWVIDAVDLATMKFRVTSIKQDAKNQFTINGLQYNEQKYPAIDSGAYVDTTPISIVNPKTQDPVTNLLLSTYDQVQQGLALATMVIQWDKAKNAVKYLVEWRKDDGSWVKMPITGNTSIEVSGIYAGNYQARVTAISAFEVTSLPTISDLTSLTGKTGTPPALAALNATGILFGIQLDWAFPESGALDTAYTEVWENSTNSDLESVQLGLFAYPTNTKVIQGLAANITRHYKARLIDRIGNVGPWTNWISGTSIADANDILEILDGQIGEGQLNQDLITKIEVGEGAAGSAAAAQAAANAAQAAADAAKSSASTADVKAVAAQATATDAQTKANKAATDISNTILPDINGLKNGLTQEKLDRQAGDTALVGQLNAYKTSNDNALAAVSTRAEAANTKSDANASSITAVTATVNTKNRTYRQNTAPTTDLVVGDIWINTTAGQNNRQQRLSGTNPPTWVDIGDPRVDTTATAVQGLQTSVSDLDGRTTANTNATTALTATVATLDTKVNTKNKTFRATSAPANNAANDLRAGDGWINTATGQNNRLSIWSGSAWLDSSDPRVATLVTQVANKADASVVSTLQGQVTNIDGRVVSNTSAITSLNSNVTTLQGQMANKADASALNNYYTKTEANAATAGAITALDASLAIGGGNLVPNSDFSAGLSGWGMIKGGGDDGQNPTLRAEGDASAVVAPPSRTAALYAPTGTNYAQLQNANFIGIEGGKFYQISAYTGVLRADAVLFAYFYDKDGTSVGNTYSTGVENRWNRREASGGQELTAYKRLWQNFQAPTNATSMRLAIRRANTTTDTPYLFITRVQAIQVESVSARLVPWSQSAQAIDVSGLATASALTALQADVTAVDGRVTSNTSALTALSGRVTNAEGTITAHTTALNNTYTKAQTDNAISGAVSTYDASLVIGGTNLLFGTAMIQPTFDRWNSTVTKPLTYSDSATSATRLVRADANAGTGTFGIVTAPAYRLATIVQGRTYTLSFRGQGTIPTLNYVYMMRPAAEGGNSYIGNIALGAGGRTKRSITFIAPFTSDAVGVLLAANGTFTADDWIQLGEIQLEEGSKATSYSLNPLEANTSLTANANAIQETNATVSNIDGRLTAATTATTVLAGRVTAVEGTAASNSSAISNMYTKNQVDLAIGASTTSLRAELQKGANVMYDPFGYQVASASAWGSSGILPLAQAQPNSQSAINTISPYVTISAAASRTGLGNGAYAAEVNAFFPALPNLTYEMSVTTWNILTNAAGGVEVWLRFYDRNGTLIAGSATQLSGKSLTANNTARHSGSAISPSNAVRGGVFFRFIADSSGNFALPSANSFSIYDLVVYQLAKATTDAATAVQGLQTQVTNIDGRTTANTNSTTALAGRVTSAEGTITSHSTAIANTYTKNQTDAAISASSTSLSASITAVDTKATSALTAVTIQDVRTTNESPDWYWTNHPRRVVNEFKNTSALGITGLGTYVNLQTVVQWSGSSGGNIVQTAASNTDPLLTCTRRSSGTGANAVWTAWTQPLKTLNDGVTANASANTATDARVTVVDGKVTAQASQYTALKSSVDGNTASISAQQTSINGLNAQYTLKLDVNGLVSGFGLASSSTSSEFLIRANRFAIAPPSGSGNVGKYAFTYQSTAVTLPNGTVIPAGLYIADAVVGSISADKINATSLSAISANLGTITTLKDPTKPNGARRVIQGAVTRVYDDNNVLRMQDGFWD